MKKTYLNFKNLSAVLLATVVGTGSLNAQVTTQTFSYTGSVQSFTVPSCVSTLSVDLRGAEGSLEQTYQSPGGKGGRLMATYPVTPGQVYNIYIGAKTGFNGGGTGGNPYGAPGGGASDIRFGGTALSNRILIAGGGGGGGVNCGSTQNQGGDGGGLIGGDGYQCNMQSNYNGTGGTQSSGGTSNGSNGQPGALGLGGNGSSTYGGGGGGGYYGGGGGSYGGGGGGSSFANSSAGSVVHTQGYTTGNGLLIISYNLFVPVPTVVSSTVICAGQTASISASGLTSYSWSTGSTQQNITVTPGTTTSYTVAGTTTNNCPAGSIITISVNPLPTVSGVTSPSVLCVGKTGTLTASGASTYAWSSGGTGMTTTVNPVTTTSYTITGTSSSGCVNTFVLPMNVNTNQISISPTSPTVCVGTPTTLTASGAGNYMWSNGHPFGILTVTPSAATSYTVSGIDIHNCPLSQVVSVGVNQLPNILASASKASICKGESVSLSAAGGASYLWNTGATGSVVTITPPLDMTYNYTVKGTDANGCSNTGFVSVTVNRCTGLNEQSASASINVYPNPSNGALNVSVGEVSKNMSIKVYNTLGSVVKVQNIAQENTSLNLQDESTGVYFIYVMENDKPVHISRIMKQ